MDRTFDPFFFSCLFSVSCFSSVQPNVFFETNTGLTKEMNRFERKRERMLRRVESCRNALMLFPSVFLFFGLFSESFLWPRQNCSRHFA